MAGQASAQVVTWSSRCGDLLLSTIRKAGDRGWLASPISGIYGPEQGTPFTVPAWVSQTGNALVESSDQGDVMKFYVRKK